LTKSCSASTFAFKLEIGSTTHADTIKLWRQQCGIY